MSPLETFVVVFNFQCFYICVFVWHKCVVNLVNMFIFVLSVCMCFMILSELEGIIRLIIVLSHFQSSAHQPQNDPLTADRNMVTFVTNGSTGWLVSSMGDGMFTMFRGRFELKKWQQVVESRLLRIDQRFLFNIARRSEREKGELIVFAAGRSPLRRIDHQLVKYWQSVCWQLTATDASGCRYTSCLSLLSPSLSFPLHSPSSIFYFFLLISDSVSASHDRLTTRKKQRAVSFIADLHF